MLVAFANQKGGVGKTTTAVNLAAFLALRGHRVLLVDLDPQANATSSLGVDKHALEVSIYDALLGGTAEEAIIATRVPGLDLLPSVTALAGAEVELAANAERTGALARALAPLHDKYPLILIDCPPSLGLLTLNGLAAADAVVVPVQCEYLALEGLTQLMETIGLVQENVNPRLELFGLVMTMFDSRLHLASQVVEQVRQHFPNKVFGAIIPRNVRIAEAPSYGEPLATFDPHSRGAQAYADLADEFLARAGMGAAASDTVRAASDELRVANDELRVASDRDASAPLGMTTTPTVIPTPGLTVIPNESEESRTPPTDRDTSAPLGTTQSSHSQVPRASGGEHSLLAAGAPRPLLSAAPKPPALPPQTAVPDTGTEPDDKQVTEMGFIE